MKDLKQGRKLREKEMFDICVIGHITKDIIRIKNIEKEIPGGVGYYFSMASKSLGSNACLITKVANKEKSLLNDLMKSNVRIFYKESEKTTIFKNIYPENLDFRIQRVNSVAFPFNIEDVANISAKIFHLGPITKDDIPLEILKFLSKKSKVSLDVQGFLREVDGREIKKIEWEEKEEGLFYVNILKMDEEEARILSRKRDVKEAAVELSKYGVNEIIITLGSKGSLVYSERKFYPIPSFPAKKLVDATGCGDTYMAGYIYKRLKSSDIEEAGRFAAATASLKLEESGPFKGTEEDVQNFLEFQSTKKIPK
ncbi:MAG TPA: ribokinase [Candidatus Aminicenantes bacterium]|nr:ribokinase [Candidatus Aminicenantes bacterium]